MHPGNVVARRRSALVLALFTMLAGLVAIALPAAAAAQTDGSTPTYGSAVVDGDPSEWDLSADFFSAMHLAADPNKEVLSNLYLRYDRETSLLYVLVLAEEGHTLDVRSQGDAYVKIDGEAVDADGSSTNDGVPPDFEWIGHTGKEALGWEASVPLDLGEHTINVHTNADGGETSAVPNRGIALTVAAPCVGPLTIEVRDADSGELVGGGSADTSAEGNDAVIVHDLDNDGTTPAGEYSCDTDVTGTLTEAPEGYRTVDGDDAVTVDEDGETLVFTVRRTQPCLGPLTVEVRHVETGELVGGGAASIEISGNDAVPQYPLEDDGSTPAGEYSCDTEVTGTLVEIPEGYTPVDDGPTTATIDEDGETIVFTVGGTGVLPNQDDCVGDVVVRVVDEDGNLVPGGTVMIEGTAVDVADGEGTVPGKECGELEVTLTAPPEGYTPVSGTTQTTTIEDDQTAAVEFVVGRTDVGGVDLPATGTDTDLALGLGMLLLLYGAIVLDLTPSRMRRANR